MTFSNATNYTVHIPESGEVKICVGNVGKGATGQLLIDFYIPASYTNTVVGDSWHPEPGFVGIQDDKLVRNPNWLHWVHFSNFAVTDQVLFCSPPIYLKRNLHEKILPIIVSASSKETKEARIALLLNWE